MSNTNKMVRFYSGATGLKTGFTSGAGYCLSASAMRDGMELIAVVMGSETSADRFAACKSMLDYGFANFSLISAEMEQPNQVPVKLGKLKSVTAEPGTDTQLLIDKAQRGSVTTEVMLEETVTAPVSKGQRLGTMTIKAGQQVLSEVPLVASEAVERLSWGDLFVRLFRQVAMAAE